MFLPRPSTPLPASTHHQPLTILRFGASPDRSRNPLLNPSSPIPWLFAKDRSEDGRIHTQRLIRFFLSPFPLFVGIKVGVGGNRRSKDRRGETRSSLFLSLVSSLLFHLFFIFSIRSKGLLRIG
ncbi:hypothetical protein IE53DRAFT_110813 [Violaceomyces palustris]|uniref:Uncharacterized protein n=1 Tax=Violaceomyces palustris TaxID=1673888 RepID=A0ACD0NWK7_9BASI|nr:hypothetical protein IE53DRAFT_110813 [Violaceomyces palustris]